MHLQYRIGKVFISRFYFRLSIFADMVTVKHLYCCLNNFPALSTFPAYIKNSAAFFSNIGLQVLVASVKNKTF